MISNIFSNVYNYNITLNFIRISYATYHNNIKYSNKDILKLSHGMGHDTRYGTRKFVPFQTYHYSTVFMQSLFCISRNVEDSNCQQNTI